MIRLSGLLILFTTTALAVEPAFREQVNSLFRERKWAEAQALLEKTVAAEPTDAEAHFLLGVSFLDRNDGEQATPALEKAVALAPANGNYFRHLGDAYGMTAQKAGLFAKMGWAKKCKTAYDKAVELDPKDLNARWSVMEFCRQAPSFVGGGMDQAYTQAAEIKKIDAARGRSAYVRLYSAEKKFAEAFGVYEEVLKEAPDDYASLFQVGRLAAVSGERLDQGREALQHCLKIDPPKDQPGAAPVNWCIGKIREKQGDVTAARTAYEAALAADPKFTPATESLAKLK